MKPVNSILSRYGTTIFTVMSGLAAEYGDINLGQGFPTKRGRSRSAGLPPMQRSP